MYKKILVGLILISGLMFSQATWAQESIVLQKSFTKVTPFFMEGHAGDSNWIGGYILSGDIMIDETKIGSVNGEVTLLNPPLDMTQPYDEAFCIFDNTIPGVGSLQVFAQVKSYSPSFMAATGDGMVAWHGAIVNGSNQLQSISGLSAGVAKYNIFSGQGSGSEFLQITAKP